MKTAAEVRIREAIWGAPNLEARTGAGYPFSVGTAPAAAKEKGTMTTVVYNTRGTPACRVLAFV